MVCSCPVGVVTPCPPGPPLATTKVWPAGRHTVASTPLDPQQTACLRGYSVDEVQILAGAIEKVHISLAIDLLGKAVGRDVAW